MDFTLINVWHVIGYENGSYMNSRPLCGSRGERIIGGAWDDVVRSGVPICRTCDRLTDGDDRP